MATESPKIYPVELAEYLKSVGERVLKLSQLFEERNQKGFTQLFSPEHVTELERYAQELLHAAKAIATKRPILPLDINGPLVMLPFWACCGDLPVGPIIIHENSSDLHDLAREIDFCRQDFECLQRQLPDKDAKGFVHTILCSLRKIGPALVDAANHLAATHSAFVRPVLEK